MKIPLLLACIFDYVAAQSGVHVTVLPSQPPMITRSDFWGCATEEIPSYFLPPRPTGALSTARLSYGDAIQTCTLTGAEAFESPFPEKSLWCGFSTAVPATLLDEYIAYGSTASSWWAERSASAVSLARSCPWTWWVARERVSFGATALNITIIEAECYAEAHATPSEPTHISSTATSTTSGSVHVQTEAPDQSNDIAGRAESMRKWMAAGTGLAVAAANSMM